MDSGSSGASRRVKKTNRERRSWSQKEEAVLLAALKELVVLKWKSDNGFRAGYLKKLEEAMRKSFPTTDLKGMPHINSKLCAWKKNYNSLSGILSRSGVGFNLNGNHMIECEDEQWEQIIKIDNNARFMRYKEWPYYDDWKEVFGKDRATGDAAEDILDAFNEIQDEQHTENGVNFGDYEFSQNDLNETEGAGDSVSQSGKHHEIPPLKGKKRKVNVDMQAVCEVLAEIGRKQDARLADLCKRIGHEFDVSKQRKEAFVLLGVIPGLSLDERFDVCNLLAKETEKLDVFLGLPEDARPPYVQNLLKNKGK